MNLRKISRLEGMGLNIDCRRFKIKMTDKKIKKITKGMFFSELLEQPELIEVLMESGMHCIGCPMSGGETIEEGAVAHGIDVDELVDKINKLRKKNKNE